MAVAQMTSVADGLRNWEICQGLVRKAAEAGASFLALPEGFQWIGEHYTQSLQVAQPLEGSIITQYRQLAKQYQLWLSLGGFQEKGPDDDHIYNSHVILNPEGEIAAVYRKMHLFDVEYDQGAILSESRFTAAGHEIVVCPTSFANLGLTTCYDLRFPELYTKMAHERDANVMLVPSAFTVPTGRAHWEILLRARAIETQSYVIAAAQVGKHSAKRESYGHAMIISPWGDILADCGDETNDGLGLIKTAELDPELMTKIRAKMPCAQHRRQDVFSGSTTTRL